MPAATALLALALLAQVALALVAMARAGRARVAAIRTRRVRMADIALDAGAWPADVRKLSNSMQNQFETPTLFFALGGIALALGLADLLLALIAWAFVACRLVHLVVHTGGNVVTRRFYAFAAGFACLVAMTLVITVRVVAGAGF